MEMPPVSAEGEMFGVIVTKWKCSVRLTNMKRKIHSRKQPFESESTKAESCRRKNTHVFKGALWLKFKRDFHLKNVSPACRALVSISKPE